MYDLLQREIANDRLRAAGYSSRVQRRRRDRSERLRAVVGRRLVSVGERLQGVCENSVAPVVTLRRS
jgi:hypothetical protein